MYKRSDGLYQAQVTIKGLKKPKYFYGKSEREVNKKMVEYAKDQAKGRKFGIVADEWEDEHYKSLQLGTKVCYAPALARAKAEFDEEYINTITPLDLQSFLLAMSTGKYGKQTVNVQKIVLRQIFGHALLKGDVISNPAAAIKVPKNLPAAKRDMPTDEEIAKIKNNCKSEMGRFAYFLLYTGCRKGEALALKWDDIDFENKRIHIFKTVEYPSNKPEVKEHTKTASSIRDIILLDKLASNLTKSKGYIFQGSNGIYTKTEFRKRWAKYCKDIGCVKAIKESKKLPDGSEKEIVTYEPTITPHQLRHAYVTMLYEAGIDAETAMTQTGHSNISTMRDIYTHIKNKRVEEAADRLNNFLR